VSWLDQQERALGLRKNKKPPKPRAPRCPCGAMTLNTAKRKRHRCDHNGPLLKPPRPRKYTPPPTNLQRWYRIAARVSSHRLRDILTGMEIALQLREPDPAEPPPYPPRIIAPPLSPICDPELPPWMCPHCYRPHINCDCAPED
jgi:hypothetical protein